MTKKIDQIKQVLEEHLSSINENTAEIQGLFDYIHQLEIKLEKLSQRLEQSQLSQSVKISVSPLNQDEKKIFLVLYTEETPLSSQEIAMRAMLPLAIVSECLSSLVSKGIPLNRSYFNNQSFFKLNPEFKEVQAKENLINLSLQSFIG